MVLGREKGQEGGTCKEREGNGVKCIGKGVGKGREGINPTFPSDD